ncbi:general secretion pathway protein D [Inhella inkyongensis]|uniref:General secretion pathway protein D n=1 Tax=Inhella inkyongensis TaxID=392593 RepID=A0A840S447_9BURK|nr:secretin N-terminal domain-containing protein [Inhella inkyongensis]MBB5204493.1 general secretion pathway protein D [Inhella inkyongensis]
MTRAQSPISLCLATLALSACTSQPKDLESLHFKKTPVFQATDSRSKPEEANLIPSLQASEAPTFMPPRQVGSGEKAISSRSANFPDDTEEVSIAIEQTPLPMFVQILYGNVLKRPYSLDPAVGTRTDPVTFKTSRPLSKKRMAELAVSLLRSYQLQVEDLEGLIKISPQQQGPISSNILMSGKQLGDGTPSFNAIHHYVEMEYVRNSEVVQWLRQIMGQRVQIQEDNARNALLISGQAGEVRAALTIIQSFDQPRMRGRIAARVTPSYASPTDLAQKLTDVLNAQGIAAGGNSGATQATVLLLPVPSISSVFVFATNQALLDHTLHWAAELDKAPIGTATVRGGLFTYAVKYADAKSLALTLGEVLGGAGSQPTAPSGASAQQPTRSSFGRVTVNNATNTLIIRGTSAEEQQQLIDLLRELDRPTKSAWIEVVVAEVTTDAKEELGVSWSGNNQTAVGSAGSRSGSLNGSGFNLGMVNDARTVMANLSLLSSKGKGRILSNPRVLARNGESATISVGREVPVVTSVQSTGQTSSGGLFGGNQLGVLQQIQYRSTGVILQVRPVINSGNRMDLEVSQEVSSAEATTTGVSSSPTISNRRIDTKISLRDGSTVLLGGLILNNGKISADGLPFLKDLPVIGGVFGKRSDVSSETELLVMITPHVINDDYEAEEVAQAVRKSYGSWVQSLPVSRVALEPEPRTEVAPTMNPNPSPRSPASSDLGFSKIPVRKTPSLANKSDSQPDEMDSSDIVTSRPITRQTQSSPTPNSNERINQAAPEKAAPQKGASHSEPSRTTESGKSVTLPGGIQGKEVTDQKLLDEIKKAIGNK